ncbi:nucleoside diphosphate-linked moiety X motif 8, mitochondrial [Elysia marginata]|uniref:Nucleoside diphosphate-linked moiety X motif 8, mitochondrial n=1 Tax=Elysia marginata TaxID=1093978 RepID=A0AAV4ECD0_9GAST|nr:nucleoside diphosphate-linked moiety X motif 8, mitochondrial [Elysia marginata]
MGSNSRIRKEDPEENKQRTQKALQSINPAVYREASPDTWTHSFAAILVPLCTVKGEPSLLFTLRSTRLKKHRGQVSFPGGNVDETDADITFTALRETQEELGIDPARCEVWGQLRALPTSMSKRRVVQPVVARITGGDLDLNQLKVNHDEVEQAFTVPLRQLCNHANIGVTRFRNDTNPFTMPVYTGPPHRIWGFTAIVTHILLTVLAPNLYTFKVVHKKALSGRHHQHGHSIKGRGS